MSTRRSLAFSFLDRYASLLITVLASMVIARLLTPGEIGVFSVTMALLVLLSTVRDLGAGQYLVQERDLTTERIRAVWSIQLGLGIGLALLAVVASYPVSLFYGEPRIRNIMLVIALNYAVNPFGSLTYAWLMREMRFEGVAMMRFSSVLAGALTSCFLAWKGYGPMSLAMGALVSTIVNALVAMCLRPKSFPWLPGFSEVRRVLAFGTRLTFSSVIGVVYSSAPELVLGKLQSLTSAGLYSRGNGLIQMFHRLFVDAVGAVCVPWFAKQMRESGGFADSFLRATSYVTAFGWTFCVTAVCLAHPLIRLLYGDSWDQAVDLTRLLGIATALSVPAALCQTALLSAGAVSVIARVTVISAVQGIILVAIGASEGLLFAGVAMIVAAPISTTLWLRATVKNIQVPWYGLFLALRKSAAVASTAAVGPVLSVWVYGPYPAQPFTSLVLGGAGGFIGFILGVIFFRHPLKEELGRAWSSAGSLLK